MQRTMHKGRNVDGANPLPRAIHRRIGDDGFKLAHISRPGMGEKTRKRPRPQAAQRFAMSRSMAGGKPVGEHGNIIAAFPERWQLKTNSGETVGEVGAQVAASRKLPQRLLRTDEELTRQKALWVASAAMLPPFEE